MGTGPRYNLLACRRAAGITYQAFCAIPHYVYTGISERKLAWRMGWLLRKFGSEQRSFPTIVAFGSHAATPHHQPTERCLQAGDIIKIDAGGVWQQMRGDVTRTFFYGIPTQKFIRRYQAVLQAQQLAFPYYRIGCTGQQIDQVARNYLHQQKLAKLFIHSLGHGVGRAIHQPPFMSSTSKGQRVLALGQVLTNEPGIYEAGWGGIRIEDMLEITSRGPKWLGQAPKQLQQIILPVRFSL